jgi:hypothetical protein
MDVHMTNSQMSPQATDSKCSLPVISISDPYAKLIFPSAVKFLSNKDLRKWGILGTADFFKCLQNASRKILRGTGNLKDETYA